MQKKMYYRNYSQKRYGSFTGLVTLEDLIEQIVGRLNQEEEELRILVNDDLSITAEGSTSIRELNKFMSWKIPEDGAKTLSGFVIDHLDHFPKGNICLTIDGYACLLYTSPSPRDRG